MTGKISKWGNSLGLRIPRIAVETLGLNDNDIVNIETKGKSIVIRPMEKRLTLESIFEDWDGTPYDSYDWGELDKPAGRELI
ncbi:MAG: AbrB/MazE/SpoVT family DNA-binding domain-containing protein [Oscillospiraceae bacterium]|nr:AbrB/MazE/SpoVT family DNA-binding domain-containing protein [Oscillospiraceae bacterium]